MIKLRMINPVQELNFYELFQTRQWHRNPTTLLYKKQPKTPFFKITIWWLAYVACN